jgi:hypothetical protein
MSSDLRAEPYAAELADEWDALVEASTMGSMLHTRAFLEYHGDRFTDASIVIRSEKGAVAGILPAAADPGGDEVVASHPGATFGGVVHDGSLVGARMITALDRMADLLAARGFSRLRYAPVPVIYPLQPAADDQHALHRLGARMTRCDLSCAVDLEHGPRFSSRRRRGLKKAKREGVEVMAGPELVADLWPVIEENLARRHGARPVHTAAEMATLIERFPADIEVILARLSGDAVAGVVLFDNERVSHAQYIASTEEGNRIGALDAVFDLAISRARERSRRYFDFGTSNNRDPERTLNESLYSFKAQFGASGVAHPEFELDLRSPSRSDAGEAVPRHLGE